MVVSDQSAATPLPEPGGLFTYLLDELRALGLPGEQVMGRWFPRTHTTDAHGAEIRQLQIKATRHTRTHNFWAYVRPRVSHFLNEPPPVISSDEERTLTSAGVKLLREQRTSRRVLADAHARKLEQRRMEPREVMREISEIAEQNACSWAAAAAAFELKETETVEASSKSFAANYFREGVEARPHLFRERLAAAHAEWNSRRPKSRRPTRSPVMSLIVAWEHDLAGMSKPQIETTVLQLAGENRELPSGKVRSRLRNIGTFERCLADGRRRAAELGFWPWDRFTDGNLPSGWHTTEEVRDVLPNDLLDQVLAEGWDQTAAPALSSEIAAHNMELTHRQIGVDVIDAVD
jgi:hypothetical protein